MSIVLFFLHQSKILKKKSKTLFSLLFFCLDFFFLFKGAFALLAFISHHIKWFPKVSIT